MQERMDINKPECPHFFETTISVAYDVDEGNSFRLWSEFDLDFATAEDAEIRVRGRARAQASRGHRCLTDYRP
jgi:hypothetical protein